tara:strand:- start:3493 stop:4356 length:864 start_codon:yes stop_codon:yes gene_type:complete
MKKIVYFLEFSAIFFLFLIFKYLPLNLSRNFASFLFRNFGKLSRANKTAINNCKHVFPNLAENEIKNIVKKSWNNLGITICELVNINELFNKNKIKFNNLENIEEFINNNKQAIYISIHQSNWEILVPSLDRMGIYIGGIYRHINNFFVDKLLLNIRKNSLKSKQSFYTPKGKKSAKDIIEALNNSLSIVLLIDQKDSSGEEIMFFNKRVKTQIGFLKIARKYKLPIIPIQNVRKKDGNIELNFFKPIYHDNLTINDKEMMEIIHNKIEKWIKAAPSQWFWQHKRFN